MAPYKGHTLHAKSCRDAKKNLNTPEVPNQAKLKSVLMTFMTFCMFVHFSYFSDRVTLVRICFWYYIAILHIWTLVNLAHKQILTFGHLNLRYLDESVISQVTSLSTSTWCWRQLALHGVLAMCAEYNDLDTSNVRISKVKVKSEK